MIDKYEYKLKFEQMKALTAEGDYESAAEIADTIQWRKVRNINLLIKAGDIYSRLKRFDNAKEILQMAYDRSPIGRMIIYRLAEIAIKTKSFAEATDYYEEFVEIAPHDNLKYVLRYKISKAKGADLQTRIAILEELKEAEYTEEWAFELAYLYHKAGEYEKCIDACDELILWFGDGIYVERALELKMLHKPLTKTQEDKYRACKQRRDGVKEVYPQEEVVRIPEVKEHVGKFDTAKLQEEIKKNLGQILNADEKETVKKSMDSIDKMVQKFPYLQKQVTEQVPKPPADSGPRVDEFLRTNIKEALEGGYGEPQNMPEESRTGEHQTDGWDRTSQAIEAVLQSAQQKELEYTKAQAIQKTEDIMDLLADVIPKIDGGMSQAQLMQEEYLSQENRMPKQRGRMHTDVRMRGQTFGQPVKESPSEPDLLRKIKRAKPQFREQLGERPYLPRRIRHDISGTTPPGATAEGGPGDNMHRPEDYGGYAAGIMQQGIYGNNSPDAQGIMQADPYGNYTLDAQGMMQADPYDTLSSDAARITQTVEFDGYAPDVTETEQANPYGGHVPDAVDMTQAAEFDGSDPDTPEMLQTDAYDDFSADTAETAQADPYGGHVPDTVDMTQTDEFDGHVPNTPELLQTGTYYNFSADAAEIMQADTDNGQVSDAANMTWTGKYGEHDPDAHGMIQTDTTYGSFSSDAGETTPEMIQTDPYGNFSPDTSKTARTNETGSYAPKDPERTQPNQDNGYAADTFRPEPGAYFSAESQPQAGSKPDGSYAGRMPDNGSGFAERPTVIDSEGYEEYDDIPAADEANGMQAERAGDEPIPSEEMQMAEAEFYGVPVEALANGKPEAMPESLVAEMLSRQDTKEIKSRQIEQALAMQMQEIPYEDEAAAEDISEQEINPIPAITELDDDLKALFSYFVPVAGMEKQICEALSGALAKCSGNGVLSGGNILIQGGRGCGKTILATRLVKALKKISQRKDITLGKIDAEKLNQKDLTKLLEQVQGGCLIIEQAGDMTRETAIKLSLLLDHDDSGILVILEDTRLGLEDALKKDENFARKFTHRITIPVFTSDELVEFGKTYAHERDYEIDNMGVLALYNRISNIQKLDTPTTLIEIKDIVDEAIRKAEKKSWKKAFSILTSRRYNDDDYIMLREKDFEE